MTVVPASLIAIAGRVERRLAMLIGTERERAREQIRCLRITVRSPREETAYDDDRNDRDRYGRRDLAPTLAHRFAGPRDRLSEFVPLEAMSLYSFHVSYQLAVVGYLLKVNCRVSR